ncbi:hypothetical protein SELMODRAFT_414202 [Selaginella moellendorffii]|uniref:PWWP domain-containing protein n=1 Tax=Selaginella moellendorffii TaxID=88036 RepID=D8RS00_SELML|nr:hypothetical protein SELMODRAFT_414202 [Selaginella moellendorffii]
MAKKRAKGSSAAIAAVQWKIGDLVLAKVKGFPAWPAQVSRAEDFGRQRNPAKVFVVFFGTKQIRFCQHSEISAFTVEARAALHARTLSKCVPSDLKRAVKEICEVADESGELTVTRELDQPGSDKDNDVQSSSNVDTIQAAGTLAQSLESRKGNGANVHLSRPDSGRGKRKRSTVQIEERTDGRDSHLNQRDWESSCTNSCNSMLEGENQGVPLVDKVLTNFAFHEELDSFNNGVLEEDEKEKSDLQEPQQHPPKFSWLRHSSRSSTKFRRRTLNFSSIKICQKRKRQIATKRLQAKVVSSSSDSDEDDDDPDYAEGFGDSLERKPGELKTAAVKKQRTGWSEQRKRPEPVVEEISDKHLPLVKRASARIIHEGCCDRKPWHEPRQKRFPKKQCLEGSDLQDLQDLKTSNMGDKRQFPLKAEKYRLRSSLTDSEAPLPPCKRRQRVLEAMTGGTEGSEDEEAAKPKAGTTSRSSRLLKNEKGSSRADVPVKSLQGPKTLRPDTTLKKLKNQKAQLGCETSREEHLPRRTLFKRRLVRNNLAVEDHELSVDYLNVTHSASRFYCEDVNRVREAYEAAKEKKQKLASKNTSAPSTSMKYYLAVSHSKQNFSVPSMLYSRKSDPHREAALSAEADSAQDALEGLLDNLSRAKDSIGRVTRQAVDCARLGTSEQAIDIIARRLETEKSFHRRIDLFLAIDSIAQWSHNQKGTAAGAYSSLIQNTLPRLLSAAAPPGNFARENRRQCLKVLQQWLERNVFPESVVRHFMREIEFHDADKPANLNAGQRPCRTERPLNDPIREMEGMQVDEYGSNASFPLPGLAMQRGPEDDEYNGGKIGGQDEELAPDPAGQSRYPHVLEQVDGELEMEDVSPVVEINWARHYDGHLFYLQAPPLPSSPPPCTPPPPPLPPPDRLGQRYYRFGYTT